MSLISNWVHISTLLFWSDPRPHLPIPVYCALGLWVSFDGQLWASQPPTPSGMLLGPFQTPPTQSTLCSLAIVQCQYLLMKNDAPSMTLLLRCSHAWRSSPVLGHSFEITFCVCSCASRIRCALTVSGRVSPLVHHTTMLPFFRFLETLVLYCLHLFCIQGVCACMCVRESHTDREAWAY